MRQKTTPTYRIGNYRIWMVRDSEMTVEDPKVKNPEDAVRVARPLFAGLEREQMLILLLTTANTVFATNVVSIGTLNAAVCHPREVFKPAIHAGAAAIICVHNHPSGSLAFSSEDRALALQLRDAGSLLDIPLRDFIVITPGSYISAIEAGLI